MNQRTYHKPPALAAALLGWLLKDEWHTPRGDFEEYFNELVHERGLFQARWWYRGQVIRLLPGRHFAKTYWTLIMLKNYFVLAYRNLLKNRVSSVINVAGLSIAIACSIIVYLFLQLHLNMDAFHKNADDIFLVGNTVDRNGVSRVSARAPTPLGPALKVDFPQIERSVRVERGEGKILFEDQVFNESIWFADDSFFDLFTFPLRYGDPHALSDQDAIFLSEQAAHKYFGLDDALGRQLTFTFNQEYTRTFTVRGVAEPFPDNASFTFNLLINFDVGSEVGGDAIDDWRGNAFATFIQLENAADLPVIAGQMDRYQALQNAANEVWPISGFTFTRLLDLSFKAHTVPVSISSGTHPATLIVFPLIAVFLLALASFNYMNIAISTATRRFKEIGVRKVMGSYRSQLVGQFLSENILQCLLALLVGMAATYFFLLPAFNSLFDDMAPLTMSFTDNLGLWGFFVVLLLVTGIAAGAYPAFYISSFNPVSIFRGKRLMSGGRNWFTRGLLTFQFVLAFITMVAGVVFYLNANYQEERDWGYAKEQTLVVPLTRDGQYNILADEMRQHPSVLHLAGSSHHVMPRGSGPGGVEVKGVQVDARRFDVSFDYLETLGLRLRTGRLFDREQVSDATQAIVINESFAQSLSWSDTEAIGQRIEWDENTTYAVIGVVEDFHSNDFSAPIQPALFRIGNIEYFQYLVMRVQAGTGNQVEASVGAVWDRLFPEEHYASFFQDTVFDSFYRENKNITQVFGFSALVALLISCMGLFGLALQNSVHRLKEISIRKVLGASTSRITQTVNGGFFLLLGIAAVIATPVSYFLLDTLLDSFYEYRLAIDVVPFLLSYTVVFSTAILTIASQIQKVIKANPAEVLRNE